MDARERMAEARKRQSTRGRLRWLLDDFARQRNNRPTPGELLDLADGVLAFVDAGRLGFTEAQVNEDVVRTLREDVRRGLNDLFTKTSGWHLIGSGLMVSTTREDSELSAAAAAGMPADALDRAEGMMTRLWVPLRLYPTLEAPPRDVDTVRRLFSFAVGEEIVRGKNWSLIGRCPRCYEFFYRVRRQRFCSMACKQETMDIRKNTKRQAAEKKKQKRKGRAR